MSEQNTIKESGNVPRMGFWDYVLPVLPVLPDLISAMVAKNHQKVIVVVAAGVRLAASVEFATMITNPDLTYIPDAGLVFSSALAFYASGLAQSFIINRNPL